MVRVGDLDVACTVEGVEAAAGEPAVVFVHGLAAWRGVWRGQVERLAGTCPVVSYDLRSHGETSASTSECSRSDLALDLIGLLDALGMQRAVLVGHSAGGVVAMQTAVDHPGRVAGLVLVGTASECNDKTAAWYLRCIEKGREHGGEAVMKAMGLKPESGPVPDGQGFAPVAEAMRTLNVDPLTDAMGKVDVPALMIVGEKDFLGAGGSVILSRAIVGSELEIVPGRGHGIYLEDPDWFAGRLAEFLRSVA
jgi:pimeloyl-ACP methyl ester carboxylesterase